MDKKNQFLIVKDHSVSGETFKLIYDEELKMFATFPQPEIDKLPEYYKSENYISHTNSKRNLFEKAYHFVRNYSLKRKLKLIEKYSTSSKKLLDIGCGTGDFLKAAMDSGWIIQGIEPNSIAREIANQKTNNNVSDSIANTEIDKDSFDIISLWHVLEHLPNLKQEVENLKSFLKKDGTLIIAVPNYKSYDAEHYKTYWAAYDVPRHLWHFSQDSISLLFSKMDMKVVEIIPMKFDSFYVSLLSEKYKSGRINYLKAFYIGFKSNLKARQTKEYSSLIYVLKLK